MRVYLATTFEGLRDAWRDRAVPPGARGFAVTPAFRESYAAGDAEELEYAALTAAAGLSRALGPGRRAVLACDVPDGEVTREEAERAGSVRVAGGVPLRDLKAVHVDEAGADDEEELLWYASQEIGDVLAE